MISDIHSNLPALEAVLEAVDRAEIERIWCLGDLVGYGAEPDACTTLVRERCEISLAGNHDIAVLDELDVSSFSETARAAVEWTQANAAPETFEYLRGLSPAAEHEGIGLFHASPRDPVWEYVLSIEQAEAGLDAQRERVGLIGHSHVSLFFTRPEGGPRRAYAHGAQAGDGALLDIDDGAWLINPGSVGQPRDGDPRAAWLLLDGDAATFNRVEYDIARTQSEIRELGLPVGLATRLTVGI